MADLFWLYTWFHSFNDYVDYCKIAQSLSRDTLRTAKSLFSFFFFFFLFDPFCFLWFNLQRKNLVRLSNLCCWKLYYYIYRPNDVSHDNYLLYCIWEFSFLWAIFGGLVWNSECVTAHTSLSLWLCPVRRKFVRHISKIKFPVRFINQPPSSTSLVIEEEAVLNPAGWGYIIALIYALIYSRDSKRERRGGDLAPWLIHFLPRSCLRLAWRKS